MESVPEEVSAPAPYLRIADSGRVLLFDLLYFVFLEKNQLCIGARGTLEAGEEEDRMPSPFPVIMEVVLR